MYKYNVCIINQKNLKYETMWKYLTVNIYKQYYMIYLH